MQIRFAKCVSFTAGIAACMVVANAVHARQAPQPLGMEIVGRASLSSSDIERVRKYSEYWTSQFASSGSAPDKIEMARSQLLRPLQNINLSPDFRFNYSSFVVPALTKLIQADNLHTTTNAILVISQIGTDQALTALVDHCDLIFQPVWQIRLAAARGCESLMKQSSVGQGGRLEAVNRLQQATANEDNNRVLQLQFAAINSADHPEVPDPARQQAREALLNAVTSVVDQVEKNNNPKPNPLIGAVNSGIIMLRDQFINIRDVQVEERRAIGELLGPRLGKILSFIHSNWQAGQDDPNLRELYGVVSANCESFISIIDTQLRGEGGKRPRPQQLQNAWNAGNGDRYKTVVDEWLGLVNQPPYQQ